MEGEKLLSATQYPGALLQALNEQRGCGLLCDVIVIVEGQEFPAHRNILSASSTYFHHLFSVAGHVVELSFVRAEIFGKILDYIYSSKIMSVGSDLLDELIKSGQELGVKFIADLAIPPAKGKNVPSQVKDSAPGTSASSPDQRDPETQESAIRPEGREATDGMPLITHSFSLQDIQFETPKITGSDWDGEDDDDEGVTFCSEIGPPEECAKDKRAASQNQPCSSAAGASDQKSCGSGGSPHLTNTRAAQSLPLSASQLNSNQTQPGAESPVSAAPQHFTGEIIGVNRPLLDSSLGASSLQQTRVTPAVNFLEEKQQPSHNGSINGSAAADGDEGVVEDDVGIISPSSPGLVSSSSLVQQPSVPKAASTEGSGVQKKQFTFSQEPSPRPGEVKIKISDVLSGHNKELINLGLASKDVADGLKIRTSDAATGTGGSCTGCEVCANTSEDTCDIVTPVQGDSEEGGAEPGDTPRKSGDESPEGKPRIVKQDEHYVLVENGRVYYICVVCQRPFLRLSSLWRHFNTHSWQKKFPCHYCDKAFALAEYRARHELLHTRERRYQCLLCGKFLLRYQNVASHLRSAHSQEPCGDTKLYLLHPCGSLQLRQDSHISAHPSRVGQQFPQGGFLCPVGSGNDGTEGTTSNSPAKPSTWDGIFGPQGNDTVFKQNQSEGNPGFGFVKPEPHCNV